MNARNDAALLPAWDDSVHDAQASFRCILKALSEPGTIQTLPVLIEGPAPLNPAATAVCLTLVDYETPLWISGPAQFQAVESYLRFHCGCPLVSDPSTAAYALIVDSLEALALDRFAQGTMEYPDRSSTLLIQVASLEDGPMRMLSGPGINGKRALRVAGLPKNFDVLWQENQAGFPLGVDIVFCCGNAIVGLPRTTTLATQIHA